MADQILLTADIVFQYVFGGAESPPILKEFLSAVQERNKRFTADEEARRHD